MPYQDASATLTCDYAEKGKFFERTINNEKIGGSSLVTSNSLQQLYNRTFCFLLSGLDGYEMLRKLTRRMRRWYIVYHWVELSSQLSIMSRSPASFSCFADGRWFPNPIEGAWLPSAGKLPTEAGTLSLSYFQYAILSPMLENPRNHWNAGGIPGVLRS